GSGIFLALFTRYHIEKLGSKLLQSEERWTATLGSIGEAVIRAAETNIDLSTLAALLGHGSTSCVHKYVHPTAEHKKAAMKRFDRKMRKRRGSRVRPPFQM
ncbi:MAG: hypothetical protein ABSE87_06170, partial [Terracidiphilus sp.]